MSGIIDRIRMTEQEIIKTIHIPTGVNIPERMNNPLEYEPHPLCIAACKELQAYLAERKDWREEIDKGKMFGVLIVEMPCDNGKAQRQNEDAITPKRREIGYLAAYSGQIGGRSDWEGFVPAVFDYLQPGGYFKTHEAEITELNHAITRLSNDEKMKEAKRIINNLQQERQNTIAAYQEKMKEAKAKRDARRQEAMLAYKESGKAYGMTNGETYGMTNGKTDCSGLSPEEEQAMIKESQFMKAELRRLKKALAEKTTLEKEYSDFQENLLRMKQLRKTLSDALQQWLFTQFRMNNYQGKSKDLLEIFRDEALLGNINDKTNGNTTSKKMDSNGVITSRVTAMKIIPPAGSGECCEPKLLQYAFEHGLKPLQMAMFWWGESPKEEIRHHLQFYPACNGKCKPILHWMLPADVFHSSAITTSSLAPSSAVTATDKASDKINLANSTYIYNKVEILYEDREIAVIHKPEGMLSVPGKDAQQPSIYSWARKQFPEATGPLIVHRLDMATSGLMVIAKTEFAYHRLQEQFTNHQVQKRYVAIVCCKDKEIAQRIKNAAKKASQEASNGNTKETTEDTSRNRGLISIPLMPDYLDRPRQVVNHEHGKEAITKYEVLGNEEHGSEERRVKSEEYNSTANHEAQSSNLKVQCIRLALYPKTGRTHQLRVHCAHREGLDAPILGDPLYGNVKADRLYLHAEAITFKHPLTGKEIHIERKADF